MMKHFTFCLCLLYSVISFAQGPTLRTEYADYTLVELFNKKTKQYDKPIARKNTVKFDHENKKITAIDTANGLKNVYNIKHYKTDKTGKFFKCIEEKSQMECTVQATTFGNKNILEVIFKNGFKLRFTKP